MWGATGVAGRLTAAYLVDQYTLGTLSLALGGQDRRRLDTLASDLADRNDTWEELPTVVGDATDPESLRAIAEDTRIVCTTVGPYTRYGHE